MSVQYKDLEPGDVFSIVKERDDKKYMKLADFGAVDVASRADCIW